MRCWSTQSKDGIRCASAAIGLWLSLVLLSPSLAEGNSLATSGKASFSGRYWALLIGIHQYDRYESVKTAVKDTEVLARLLDEDFGFNVIRPTKPHQLKRAGIIEQFRQLIQLAKPEDSIVIVFSGHGYRDATGRGYWVPSDGDLKSKDTSLISNDLVLKMLQDIKSTHVMLVVDSCFAGSLNEEGKPTDNFPKSLTKLPLDPLFLNPPHGPITLQDEGFRIRAQYKSRMLLTSGADEPVSDDDTKKGGHSLFGYYLIEELRNHGLSQSEFGAYELCPRLRADMARNAKQHVLCKPLSAVGDAGGELVLHRQFSKKSWPDIAKREAARILRHTAGLLPEWKDADQRMDLEGEVALTGSSTSSFLRKQIAIAQSRIGDFSSAEITLSPVQGFFFSSEALQAIAEAKIAVDDITGAEFTASAIKDPYYRYKVLTRIQTDSPLPSNSSAPDDGEYENFTQLIRNFEGTDLDRYFESATGAVLQRFAYAAVQMANDGRKQVARATIDAALTKLFTAGPIPKDPLAWVSPDSPPNPDIVQRYVDNHYDALKKISPIGFMRFTKQNILSEFIHELLPLRTDSSVFTKDHQDFLCELATGFHRCTRITALMVFDRRDNLFYRLLDRGHQTAVIVPVLTDEQAIGVADAILRAAILDTACNIKTWDYNVLWKIPNEPYEKLASRMKECLSLKPETDKREFSKLAVRVSEAFAYMGQSSAALKTIGLIEQDRDKWDALYLVAKAFLSISKRAEAMAILGKMDSEIVRIPPSNMPLYEEASDYLIQLHTIVGETDRPIKLIGYIPASYYRHEELLNGIISLLLKKGRTVEAFGVYRQHKTDRHSGDDLRRLIIKLVEIGKSGIVEHAIMDYKDNEKSQVLGWFAQGLAQANMPDKATAVMRQCGHCGEDAVTWALIAQAYVRKEKYEDADKVLKAVEATVLETYRKIKSENIDDRDRRWTIRSLVVIASGYIPFLDLVP